MEQKFEVKWGNKDLKNTAKENNITDDDHKILLEKVFCGSADNVRFEKGNFFFSCADDKLKHDLCLEYLCKLRKPSHDCSKSDCKLRMG